MIGLLEQLSAYMKRCWDRAVNGHSQQSALGQESIALASLDAVTCTQWKVACTCTWQYIGIVEHCNT